MLLFSFSRTLQTLTFIFGVSLSTLGLTAATPATPMPMKNTPAAAILVFGDSLSAGYGLAANEDWPSLLQQQLQQSPYSHYRIVNASISGETSAGGLARFAKTLAKNPNTAIVILELGANDGLQGLAIQEMRQNLVTMIQLA